MQIKCTRCTRTAVEGKKLCQSCIETSKRCEKKRKQYFEEHNLCNRCGKRSPKPNLKLCQECSSRMSKINKKVYSRYEQSNLCKTCGKNIPEPGYKNCRECLNEIALKQNTREEKDKANRRSKIWREKRKSSNICVRCGKRPPRPNRTICEECFKKGQENGALQLKENRHVTQRRKEQGVCTRCGNPEIQPGSSNCESCKAKIREKHRQTRYSGNMRLVLERDNQTCQLCGGKKYIHVHHIDGNGTTSEHPNDDPSNLIVLCNLCHYSITNLRRGPVNLEKLIFLLTSYPIKD